MDGVRACMHGEKVMRQMRRCSAATESRRPTNLGMILIYRRVPVLPHAVALALAETTGNSTGDSFGNVLRLW